MKLTCGFCIGSLFTLVSSEGIFDVVKKTLDPVANETTIVGLLVEGTSVEVEDCGGSGDVMKVEKLSFDPMRLRVEAVGTLAREVVGGTVLAKTTMGEDKNSSIKEKAFRTVAFLASRHKKKEPLCAHLARATLGKVSAACPLPKGNTMLPFMVDKLPSKLLAGRYILETRVLDTQDKPVMCFRAAIRIPKGPHGEILRSLRGHDEHDCEQLKGHHGDDVSHTEHDEHHDSHGDEHHDSHGESWDYGGDHPREHFYDSWNNNDGMEHFYDSWNQMGHQDDSWGQSGDYSMGHYYDSWNRRLNSWDTGGFGYGSNSWDIHAYGSDSSEMWDHYGSGSDGSETWDHSGHGRDSSGKDDGDYYNHHGADHVAVVLDHSKCSDQENDCCAHDEWGEPQTCRDGYVPVPDESCGGNLPCKMVMDGKACYGCVPPPTTALEHLTDACHDSVGFWGSGNRVGSSLGPLVICMISATFAAIF